LVVADADDASEEQVRRLGRVALVEREEEHSEAEAEREHGSDRAVAFPAAQREQSEHEADGERASQHSDDGVEADHERAGRSGEAELGDRVHGEARAARDDERSDHAGRDRDDGACEQRGVNEVLGEKVGEHQCWWSTWWTCWSSGVPTTTTRPRTRRTSTGVP